MNRTDVACPVPGNGQPYGYGLTVSFAIHYGKQDDCRNGR